jgi:hypothetical protein
VLAGVRKLLVHRVRSCTCCRGYGIVRCQLCNGMGAVEWVGECCDRRLDVQPWEQHAL